jgi:hypothetical protein
MSRRVRESKAVRGRFAGWIMAPLPPRSERSKDNDLNSLDRG